MVFANIPFQQRFDICPPSPCGIQHRGHSSHWALMKSTQRLDRRLCILVGHTDQVVTLWCEGEFLYFYNHDVGRIAEAMAWSDGVGWLARTTLRVHSDSDGRSAHLFNLLPFRDGPLPSCRPHSRP